MLTPLNNLSKRLYLKITPYFLLVTVSILCPALDAAIADTGSVSSVQAAYDGNALVLTGQVVLDHGLGQMIAEKASLQRQETGKEFPFSMIHLFKDVVLKLKTEAQIRCGSADLDFNSLKGLLLADADTKVIYSDTLKKKTKQESPFRIASRVTELELSRQGHDGNKSDYDIDRIVAKEEVVVEFAQAFSLEADHIVYHKKETPSGKGAGQPNFVTAYPKDEHSYCQLKHEGDCIQADLIDLDLQNSKVQMQNPKGFILAAWLTELKEGRIDFKSDDLTWEHEKNSLLLKGHVQVEENSLGKLNSEDELLILQNIQDHKRTLKSIRSSGKTRLEYKDPNDEMLRVLSSFEGIRIDQEKLQAFVDSPVIDGKIPLDLQLSYEDSTFVVFSDKGHLEYSMVGDSLQPVSVILRGNVRLRSKDENQPPRAALADRVSYSPSTQTLILGSNPGKRVLFWDEEQGLRISAREVHVTSDPDSNQPSVKGVGNVSFAFTLEETRSLETFFPSFLKRNQRDAQ